MLRNLRLDDYVPTLGIRPGEMRALEELPEVDKDSMFPLFLLAPWASSKTLEKSFARIEKAFGNRPYFLDTDEAWWHKSPSRESQVEFLKIRDSSEGDQTFFDYVADYENVVPVIQFKNRNEQQIRTQIQIANRLGRGFGFRFDAVSGLPTISVLNCIEEIEHANFVVFVDAGWDSDIATLELQATNIINLIRPRNSTVPYIVSSSSFPKNFSHVVDIETIGLNSRQLLNNLRRRFNDLRLIYSDWASSKPRSYDGGSKPLPRIDFATRNEWVLARNKKQSWDYQQAAKAIVDSNYWHDRPKVWGSYMIEKTANDDAYSIDSSPKAIAARINLHLHIQANYHKPIDQIVTDDPYVE